MPRWSLASILQMFLSMALVWYTSKFLNIWKCNPSYLCARSKLHPSTSKGSPTIRTFHHLRERSQTSLYDIFQVDYSVYLISASAFCTIAIRNRFLTLRYMCRLPDISRIQINLFWTVQLFLERMVKLRVFNSVCRGLEVPQHDHNIRLSIH